MRNGSSSPSRRGWFSSGVLGLLIAGVVVGQAGLVEAISFSRGGYQIFLVEALRLIAAYALVGIAMAATGLAVVWAVAAAGRSLAGIAVQPRFALALLPIWGCALVAAIFLNKWILPRFLSLPSLAGNLLVVLIALAIAWWLARLEKLRTALLWLVACLAVLDVATWSVFLAPGGQAERSSAPRAAVVGAESQRPTLVLVVVDTLRADHLGTYGYPGGTSPSIDALAEESVVFERAYSPANWTRPAVASLMTSTPAGIHGVTDFQYALPRSSELVTESLQSAGYRTAIFSGNPNLEPEDGYRRGTDLFTSFSHRGILGRSSLFQDFLAADLPDLEKVLRKLLGEPRRLVYEPHRLTDRALEWLERSDGPSFAYLHYVGPHAPYLPPEDLLRRFSDHELDESVARPPGPWAGSGALSVEKRRRMVAQYDAEILWHDQEVGRLVRALEEIATGRDVVLVVTSDHGEVFGENGVWGHGQGLFEELVRIPLILWCSPPCRESGRSRSLVSLLDIAPTLLELAGVDAPSSFEGDSLLSILRSPEDYLDRVVISENLESSERSIRTREWTYAEMSKDSAARAWFWSADGAQPLEVGALTESSNLEKVATLRALLAEHRGTRSARREIELDEERVEELRALGYLN